MTSGFTGAMKKLTASALVLGAMASVSVGTFATFTAQASNPSSGFQIGSIVLSNTRQGGTTCLSTAGGATNTNANAGCDTLFSLTARKPGDQATVNLTLKNEGSLPASAFKVFMSSGCAGADAVGETYHGTGDPCGQLQLYIQEFSDAAFTTKTACRYGGSADAGVTCDFSDTTKTLSAFATAYPSSTTPLTLAGSLAAGGSRYFEVGVKLPSTADNTVQGRKATAGFDWRIEQ